jgi:hypothetical protein
MEEEGPMINKPFDVWLETLKRHVATIQKHETLDRTTMKFVFEHAIAHLVLGWSMVSSERATLGKEAERIVSRTLAMAGSNQDKVNKDSAARVAKFEAAPLWWKAGDRFEKFVEYTAKILCMSTQAPYETVFSRLAEVTDTTTKARRIWRMVTKRSHDGPHFAEAVARLVDADLKNVDVRDDVPDTIHNLSVLFGIVEKFLRDRGFTPARLNSEVDLFGRRFEPQPPVVETTLSAIRRRVRKEKKSEKKK